MSVDPIAARDLFVVVAAGTAGLVLGTAAACRMLARPRWQRAAWLVFLMASAGVLTLELTGVAAGLLAWRADSRSPSVPETSSPLPGVAATLPEVTRSVSSPAAVEPATARLTDGSGTGTDRGPLAQGWGAWAVGGWLVVAGVLLGRLVVRHAVLMAFVVKHGRSLGHPLAERIAALAGRLGHRRPVAVFESDCIEAPIALGLFTPTIGLPTGFATRFTPLEQDVMLAHELAHLAGRDPGWRLAADALAACMWWQPCVWWMRGRLAAASEAVADEASRVRPDGPQALAACLVRLARKGLRARQLGWLGVDGSRFRSGLGRRVERLLTVVEGPWRPPHWTRERLLTSSVAITLVAAMIMCTAGARSQPPISGGSFMQRIDSSWQRSVFGAVVCAALVSQVQAEPAPAVKKTSSAVEAVPAGASQPQPAEPMTAIDVVEPILYDIALQSHVLSGFQDPRRHMEQIRRAIGEAIAGMTPTVAVPAMLNFQVRGQWITRQIMFIGIDEATHASVSDFGRYLQHPANRAQLSFDLRDAGYDTDPGVPTRRERNRAGSGRERPMDPATEQFTGIVLGIGLASSRDATGGDRFLVLPGDDVKVTFPTAGKPPKLATDTFTIVDFYESTMSEYDSSVAFVPIASLQRMRGMIDPESGLASVDSIWIRLKDGVDRDAVCNSLRQIFPADGYAISTGGDKR